MSKRIPRSLNEIRLDISDYVWHFTNRDSESLETLRKILKEGYIKGGTDNFCLEKSVCLTEMPLTEAIRQSQLLDSNNYSRLSDYGIGFKKKWIFERGGLPVIYQPEKPQSKDQVWRYVKLDLSKGIDFTWQREWRVKGDKLEFDASENEEIIVVCRSENEILKYFVDDYYVDPERDEVYYDVKFRYITHERLTEAKKPSGVDVFSVNPEIR